MKRSSCCSGSFTYNLVEDQYIRYRKSLKKAVLSIMAFCFRIDEMLTSRKTDTLIIRLLGYFVLFFSVSPS